MEYGKKNKMWEQKSENRVPCVSECGHHTKETVYLEAMVLAKVDHLMAKFPNLEWLAYLVGEEDKVMDLYIPKQEVSSGSVENIVSDPTIKVMGVIHSHHNLGLHTFSARDESFINDNHSISILVWNNGIMGQKKTILPCGSQITKEVNIVKFHKDFDADAFEVEINDNISEYKYVYTGYTGPCGPATGLPLHVPRVYEPRLPGDYVIPGSEKKNQRRPIGSGASGKDDLQNDSGDHNEEYEEYLDSLVYGDKDIIDFSVFDEERLDGFPSDAEVEDHFDRIERESLAMVRAAGGAAAAGSALANPWDTRNTKDTKDTSTEKINYPEAWTI